MPSSRATIPGLHGAYLFGDLCDGRIRALVADETGVTEERDLGVAIDGLVSFGEGVGGKLYALSLKQGVFQLEQG